MKNITKSIGIVIIGLTINCSQKTAPTSLGGERIGKTVELKNKSVIWEAFDTLSTIAKTEIKSENLQGLWKAYKGVLCFGEWVKAMELTKPMIIEVKDDTYRRNSDGDFEKFTIKDNLIIKITETNIDTGIINKITPAELTISWKDKLNYTRYYYTKEKK